MDANAASAMKGKENLGAPNNAQETEDLASLLHQGSKLIQTHQCDHSLTG